MSKGDFTAFEAKMRGAGVAEPAIRAFERSYGALCRDETGTISESEIDPAGDLPGLPEGGGEFDPDLLARTVVIKLNGGLGTSMGLEQAKSLLEVRPGLTFLDLIVKQIESLRASSGSKVRLLLMNSFSTSEDTLDHLAARAPGDLSEAGEVELMQNQVPKIDAASLAPVEWPENPPLEWCPPGHGDLYPALVGSGWLDRLLGQGVRYAFVSNSDNLGAVLSPEILAWFAASEAPFLMEVTRRTAADRKGGHLAVRKSDGQLLLREVAQCPDGDIDAFQDIDRHRYFNTNSIWLRLDRLKERLEEGGGVLPLPMIRNRKTVDPRDKSSTPVFQLEVAMGAAIECFEGARAMVVPRSRFAPVKTSGDLLALRSDAYEVTGDGRVRLVASRDGRPPVVKLDDRYKFVDALGELGVPSLRECDEIGISGPLRFAEGVTVAGKVSFSSASDEPAGVAPGRYEDASYQL